MFFAAGLSCCTIEDSNDYSKYLLNSDTTVLVSIDAQWSEDEVSAKAFPPPEPDPEPEPALEIEVEEVSRGAYREDTVEPVTIPQARESVAETALQYLGYPYVHAGKGPNVFDCSGFTSYIYGLHGISISPWSEAQKHVGVPVSLDEARAGDLFVKHGHVGIYLGDGTIVHASSPSTGVTISPLSWYDGVRWELRRL